MSNRTKSLTLKYFVVNKFSLDTPRDENILLQTIFTRKYPTVNFFQTTVSCRLYNWIIYQYITELVLMIHKYIPYSAYQIKTVNCCQLIWVPLKYFDNYLMDASTAGRYWCKILQKTHSNCEFKSLMVEYRRCDY